MESSRLVTLSIDRIYAFIAIGEEGEGILGRQLPNGNWIPLIGADETAVTGHREYAQMLADASGKRVVLTQFENRTDLEVIEPQGQPAVDLPEYDLGTGFDTRTSDG